MGPSTALSIDVDFDPAENGKVLRSTHFVIPREDPLAQRHSLSRQVGGFRMHASDLQVGVQKFECGFGIGNLVDQVEARPGLCQLDLQLDAR